MITARTKTAAFGAGLLGLAGLFALVFRDSFGLFALAWGTDEYSHAPLAALIGLLWLSASLQRRPEKAEPSFAGLALLAGAFLLHAAAAAISNSALSELSFILALYGLAVAAAGPRFFKAHAPAFLFLLFVVPLPPIVQANLTAKLQLLSSTLGVDLLQLFGVPVFQTGNVIDLGRFKLQVAEACSGLRYLFPLLSFAYLAAFLSPLRAAAKGIVILSALPFTVLMNALRIAIVGLAVDARGIEAAEGLVHFFEGWVVFGFCLLFLAAEMRLLAGKRVWRDLESFLPDRKTPLLKGPYRLPGRLAVSLLLLTLLAALTQILWDRRPPATPPHRPLAEFPMQIGPWAGRRENLDPAELKALNLSDYLLADYQTADGRRLDAYIAYYASQKHGAAPHSPEVCLPGGGWAIESFDPSFAFFAGGEKLTVNRALIKRDGAAMLVYYWLRERGRDVSSVLDAKWLLLRDAVRLNRSDGALIRLTIPVENESGIAKEDEILQKFVASFRPLLDPFAGAPPGRVPDP